MIYIFFWKEKKKFLYLFHNKRPKISLFIYLFNDVGSNNSLKNSLIDLESKIISKI